MGEEAGNLTRADFVDGEDLETAALVVSAVPLIGGPLSNIFNGIAGARHRERVIDVLFDISARLRSLESGLDETYVGTDEFEELLEETIRRVARERSQEKRRIYGDFLIGVIESPREPYDEQLRFLRTLEELQPDHLLVLRAYLREPDPDPPSVWSLGRALQKRIPDMTRERLQDFANQLYDMRLLSDANLGLMVTGRGGEQLGARITTYGRRFAAFLQT